MKLKDKQIQLDQDNEEMEKIIQKYKMTIQKYEAQTKKQIKVLQQLSEERNEILNLTKQNNKLKLENKALKLRAEQAKHTELENKNKRPNKSNNKNFDWNIHPINKISDFDFDDDINNNEKQDSIPITTLVSSQEQKEDDSDSDTMDLSEKVFKTIKIDHHEIPDKEILKETTNMKTLEQHIFNLWKKVKEYSEEEDLKEHMLSEIESITYVVSNIEDMKKIKNIYPNNIGNIFKQ